MKIASITITMNDDQSLDQWVKFYNLYGKGLYKHFIVDNNSSKIYKNKLKFLFPNSIIIERKVNGGTTAAYNDGIRKALEDTDVDSIMLIANDIKIKAEDLELLHNLLFSSVNIGAVGPLLLDKDENTIVTYGEKLNRDMSLNRLFHQKKLTENLPEMVESECLPGGINLIKRDVYEKVGFQDESLFMYMDENDYFHRIAENGFRIVAIRDAISAHCHIATEGKQNDNSLAWFYINRNHILVCKKYRPKIIVTKLFIKKMTWYGLKMSVTFIRYGSYKKIYYYYLGLIMGIIGIRNNFISK